MSERAAAIPTGVTATSRPDGSATNGHGHSARSTRPRCAAGDPGTRCAGAISLAAAIGGILLGVDTRTPLRSPVSGR